MYLLIALAAAAAYGAGDFMGGIASRRAPIVPVIIVSQTVALGLVMIAAPMLAAIPSGAEFGWGAAAGLAYGVGLLLLYRGLADGQMSVVAPITGVCAPALPVVFGLAIGERPGPFALTGVIFAIVAIVLISRNAGRAAEASGGEEPTEQSLIHRRVVLTAMGAGIAIGLFFIALARTHSDAGLWPLVATRVVTVLCYLIVAGAKRQSLKLPQASLHAAFAAGALDICANTLYLLSVRAGLISLAATVTSLYPATTIVLASLVLRERLRRHQIVGLACAAAALLLMTSTA